MSRPILDGVGKVVQEMGLRCILSEQIARG